MPKEVILGGFERRFEKPEPPVLPVIANGFQDSVLQTQASNIELEEMKTAVITALPKKGVSILKSLLSRETMPAILTHTP